jgi:hypothetical protein
MMMFTCVHWHTLFQVTLAIAITLCLSNIDLVPLSLTLAPLPKLRHLAS